VPLDGLAGFLEVPFVDERDGTSKRHAFAAEVERSGELIRLRIGLLNEWVRLAYGSLSEPGFQPEASRLRLAYTFAAYVPVREGDASVGFGGKALATLVVPNAESAQRLGARAYLRESDLTYELPDGGRLAFRRGSRARASREPPRAARRAAALLGLSVGPAVLTQPLKISPTLLPAKGFPDLAERLQLAETSIARELRVDVTMPCATLGAFYVEQTPGGPVAVGCRDALRLGTASYRQYDELLDLRHERYRVYRSLQQPGRFLLMPAVYRIGRHEPGSFDGYRPTVMLYALLSAEAETESKVVLDASLHPDVLPADRRRLDHQLRRLSPDPQVDLPTDIPARAIEFSWTLPDAVADEERTMLLPGVGIRTTIATDPLNWQLLRDMLGASGIAGSAELTLPDGTSHQLSLELDLRRIAGPAAGAVSVTQAPGTATLRNELDRELDLLELETYGASGSHSIPINATLAAGADREIDLPAGTEEAYPVYRLVPGPPATLTEERSFVEDIETNVVFVNLIDLQGRGLEAVEIEGRLLGVPGSAAGRLAAGADVATLEFVLPLTTWLEQHVLEFRITTKPAGTPSATGPWQRWDVAAAGNVIGLQASNLP
jgi:hypothetical protein